MSNEIEHAAQPSDQAIGLFVQDGDTDRLTDILVEALCEALRIMGDEISCDTIH